MAAANHHISQRAKLSGKKEARAMPLTNDKQNDKTIFLLVRLTPPKKPIGLAGFNYRPALIQSCSGQRRLIRTTGG